jgi:glycosyltransferase involved in cell wall biosynthesis
LPSTSVLPSPGRRICFFNTTPFWGGGEKWHLEAALRFRNRGHDVVVLGHPGSPLVLKARDHGLATAEFGLGNASALNPAILWRLVRFFHDRRIEAVVFNGPLDLKAGGLAALMAGVPRRVYRRGLALPTRNRWTNRYLFNRVLTHIVPNSKATRRIMFRDLVVADPDERIRVITNGIDLEAFDARPFNPPEVPAGPAPRLVNVGRLTAQKGQEILLEVARRLKDEGVEFQLLIAGEGERRAELTALARDLDVQDRVEFLGFVEDVTSLLRQADVFVFTSRWEGMSNALLEAAAAATPVVTVDTTSNGEAVIDGETGFVVPAGDTEAFAARLRALVEDPELRARMGAAGRRLVEGRFRLDRKMDEWERLLSG